jgi:hypothetical protein
MSDFQDAFNRNNGLNNAMGNLAAINQRNLIADSDADLERLKKKATTLDPDAFLRGMAALQANVQILGRESGALSNLSDMKALRQLKSQLVAWICGICENVTNIRVVNFNQTRI